MSVGLPPDCCYYGVYKGTTGNEYSIKGLKDNEGDKEYEEEKAGCKSHE
jgi:hypothetical protein